MSIVSPALSAGSIHRRPIARWPLLALIALLPGGCSSPGEPVPAAPAIDPELEAWCPAGAAEVERRIDELLPQLTLEEKAGLMAGSGAPVAGMWWAPGLDRVGIPAIAMTDGPRGVGRLAGTATAFPVAMARGASWDPDLERRVGEAIGREARAFGASVILAPTINLLRHPRWGRAQETYGEDPALLGAMGAAFVEGAQEHVLASAKHFALNSVEDTRLVVSANVDDRALRELYLPHFRQVVQQARVASVMSAYNRVNGTYCAENAALLSILKDEWGFPGFVESDWVFGTRSTADSALAGLDLEMPAAAFYGPSLAGAVTSGAVPESVLDDSVRRLVRARLCHRLDTDPPAVDPTAIATAEHRALARRAAEESIVLLENDGTLPLDRERVARVVVLGPLADLENIGDEGSSAVEPPEVVTALEGLRAAAGPIEIVHLPDMPLVDLAAVAGADAAVVFVGLRAHDEGENLPGGGGDRTSLALDEAQAQLVLDVAAAQPHTIVVLEGGSAITPGDWAGAASAVLHAWYPGMEGGHAIAAVLLGDTPPGGRMPFATPVREEDLPLFDNRSEEVTYDLWHGYRHLARTGTPAAWAFGYGLSTTTFAWAEPVADPGPLGPGGTLRVRVDVTNTGDRRGVEVVELYASAPGDSPAERWPRWLVAFARVELDPGETATAELEVAAEALERWDEAGGATLDPGTWTLTAARHAEDQGSSLSVEVR